ncbi:MAG: glycosyltransferase family 2 protein [Ignavibacteriae bacterium]|nr:glycosyltransferase family 2 protein [Ignavibacteria bacterium]MBI3364602.1 glycosyltransferase family 2 protein [Ignavibacteriota bacterium]
MPIDYSVVIVTYNSAGCICDCLQSLLSQDSNVSSLEIVIVDNASEDVTLENIRRQFPHVRLVENGKNLGFAAAVNQGAALASGTTLLLLNPDTIVQKDFFSTLHSFIDRTPEAAIVGCNMLDGRGAHQPSCWKRPNVWRALLEAALPYTVSVHLVTDNPDRVRQVEMVSGGCMAVRKEVFEALGRFDEQFFLYYEDADFCLRAKRAGCEIFFLPDARVVHYVRGSSSDSHADFFEYMYRSKLLFFRKHSSALIYGLVSAIVVLGIVMRTPIYYIAGILLLKKDLRELSAAHLRVVRTILGGV